MADRGSHKWWTLLAACVATFMLLLDITIVNVALPAIQRDLHSSFSDLQWVVDAYALMLATLLLTAGSLADLLGRRRVFAAGLALFTVSSLLCGLASSPLFLNLARGAQGIGGAAMFATSLALIAQAFSGRERGTAFGLWGATTGAAVAIGPLVGGALTQGAGWPWIFYLNLPIGAAALAITFLRLGESRDEEAGGVDWAGLVSFSGALFMLVFALIRGNADGWTSAEILALFAGSAVALVAFVAVELAQRRPMFDLTLLRLPTFAGASIVAFALSASMFAMFLYLTLYIQDVLGYSPLGAGLRFLPVSMLAFLVAPIAGKLSAQVPVRALLGGGLVLVGTGLALMSGISASSGWTALLPGFIVAGAGIGLVNPPLASTAIGVVPPARSGMASGINSTFRQVGIATGIAGLGAIFQSHVQDEIRWLTAGAGFPHRAVSGLAAAVSSGGSQAAAARAPAAHRAFVEHVARSAFVSGLHVILLVGAGVAFAGAALAFALVRRRDFVHAGAPQLQPSAPPARPT